MLFCYGGHVHWLYNSVKSDLEFLHKSYRYCVASSEYIFATS